ncbi:MAG: molybdopterin molybdotransferase MoeA [Clostridia bacterium]|nr:molybdopterin molybdotransferase MoeA [Clostridia bacterium]
MQEMISLEEAQEVVLSKVHQLPAEKADLLDAWQRVLAEDVCSKVNLPPFNRSPLDGYALRAADTQNATQSTPAELIVTEEVPAGYVAMGELISGTAVKIMTGAPIPRGADAVIRFEDTKEEMFKVKIFNPLKSGDNISRAGEDVTKGELILTRGEVLTPAAIGMLAAIGQGQVQVVRRPRVAILSTGDELVDIGEPLPEGKIRNSNLYLIAAAVKAAGGEPVLLGIVPDRLAETSVKFHEALAAADLVISTGGVSVGDYDMVHDALKQVGAKILFWKVAVKPGTPVVAAESKGKLIFGLSGNPAGASIIFEVLVKPVIRKLVGERRVLPGKALAHLDDEFSKRSGMRRLLRGRVYRQGEVLRVTLTGKQNPGVLKSLLNCNALIDVPAGSDALGPGKQVAVLLMD